ncbi:GtrA family protein [Clostridium sp. CTA-5]
MTNFIQKFKDTFFSKQFIMFVIIGIINTFNGVVFSYIYSSFLNENIAFILGYISGLFISYLLNSFITFKERLDFSKFIKFAISYIPNFIIQNIVVLLVFNIMGLHKLIAYGLAALIGVPVTFILMKFFAFKKERI